MLFIYIGTCLLVIIDQLTKYWVVQSLALHESHQLLDGILSLQYIQNTGAAWGVLAGSMWLFFIITVIVVAFMIYWIHHKQRHLLEKLAFMLILAGAIGNFIDRMSLGYVVDMIRFDFIQFPVFNVADMCLTCGIIVMLIYAFFFENDNKKVG